MPWHQMIFLASSALNLHHFFLAFKLASDKHVHLHSAVCLSFLSDKALLTPVQYAYASCETLLTVHFHSCAFEDYCIEHKLVCFYTFYCFYSFIFTVTASLSNTHSYIITPMLAYIV